MILQYRNSGTQKYGVLDLEQWSANWFTSLESSVNELPTIFHYYAQTGLLILASFCSSTHASWVPSKFHYL